MHERLRCAIIGVGGFGIDHLSSLLHCRRATAVAIAETNPERAKFASEQFKIPRSYSDYREVLDQPDIDAVIIALPNYLHAPVAIEALKARKHVLVEKPMATNGRDAAKMVETAKKMRRTLMVAQNFRFDRHAQTAKFMCDRGDLGEIYHARGFWLRRAGIPRIGSWFTQKQRAGGGCTYDIGVHMLDLCLYLMGEFDVTSVSAQTHAKFGPRGLGEFGWGKSEIDPHKPFDVEDFSIALLRLAKGRTVLLETSWACHHNIDAREHGIDLFGTEAGLTLFPARLLRNGANGYESILAALPKIPQAEDRVQHFVNCVIEGKKPLVDPEQSLQVQRVMDAIYESARTGKEAKVTG